MATITAPISLRSCVYCNDLGHIPTFPAPDCHGGIYQCRHRENKKRDLMSRWRAEQNTCENFKERKLK